MSIKFLAEDDRPREKFLLKGKSALSDSELLTIILGSGNNEDSAVELARKIRGLRKRLWGIDFNLYKELLQITQNNIRVFEDKTDSWKYGVATHGLNNISGKKREKMFEREENGMIFIDHKLEDYIPLEVINRLKDSKQYISIHKKLH